MTLALPLDLQVAAAEVHAHTLVEQSAKPSRHYGSAGAATAGFCLADTTLPHAQIDFAAAEDLHEAHVRTLGEPWVSLDQWAQRAGRGVGYVLD
jgi:hypothetical protein